MFLIQTMMKNGKVMTMTTNVEVISIAQKYVGKKCYDAIKYCGISSSTPWCDAFVTYSFYKAGAKNLYCKGTKQTYCPASIKICRQLYAEIPLYLAMRGDVIFFDWEPNGTPNHVGFVYAPISTSEIKTLEGNTSGGKVAYKERTLGPRCRMWVFRPHYTAKYTIGVLEVDGVCGYSTIANLQKALGIKVDGILGRDTVKALQRHVGVAPDACWGKKTSRAVQKLIGAKVDGEFGKESVKALQKWVNAANKVIVKTDKGTVKTASKAQEKKHAYKIKVNVATQVATLFDNDVPIKTCYCSTAKKGCTTPLGTFKIGKSGKKVARARTAKMSSGKSFAEFLIRFKGSKCQHTVPYKTRQETGHVFSSEFNKLGTRRSSGCVRVPWDFAKFCYENCPDGTPYIIYSKEGEYPMGEPAKLTSKNNIDPTYKK